tara:strand:- start:2286 stop:2597 length:312 start_codon:yes stop_codon:yes gene_type:complete
MEFQDLGSMSGIIGATLIILQILKKLMAEVDGLKVVPIWVYGVAISAGLTVLASKVLNILPGDNLLSLVWQAALLAASSSGFYEWIKDPKASPELSAAKRNGR